MRSLGRRGVPVRVLADGDDRLAALSRYTRDTVEWPAADVERLELLVRLSARDGRRWALMPSADETARFVANNHDALGRHLVLTTPNWDVLKWADDKRLTYELADRAGVDHPLTLCPRDRSELETADLRFPVLVKPGVKNVGDRLAIDKAWPAHDLPTLLRLYDDACELGNGDTLMVQELIPGGGSAQLSYAALVEDGVPTHELFARRTRQYPADIGKASTFVETIADPGVAAPSRRFLEAWGFSGLVELEYKRDAAGRFLLLDVNPRVWGWHSICAEAGLDFPWLYWLRLIGKEPRAAVARPGVRWVRVSTDLPTALSEVVRGRLSPWTLLWSLRPPHVNAVFARDDLQPGLLELPLLLRMILRRVISRRGG